jgi:hypothetical protein
MHNQGGISAWAGPDWETILGLSCFSVDSGYFVYVYQLFILLCSTKLGHAVDIIYIDEIILLKPNTLSFEKWQLFIRVWTEDQCM